MSHVHPLEQTAHSRAGAPSKERGFRTAEQWLADVFISKAARDVVAVQERLEEL